jgi:transposase
MLRVAAKFVPRLLTDALFIHEFLTNHETTVVPQLPYSPDLAPADFYVFLKLKPSLKGRRFQTIEEIEKNLI